MTIDTSKIGTTTTLSITGRLDTITSPDLESQIQKVTDAKALVVDCSKLEYISSAGLRVLLAAHKEFAKKDGLTVTNVSETVMDIFEVTGFDQILTIK
ncbi:MAG: STAS domain-containing protein [Treponema sp.]|nr:STAS domain-containing protein [Treponema sp.]MBQ5499160.1 STAS domain-containing protein [Treponema sp.]